MEATPVAGAARGACDNVPHPTPHTGKVDRSDCSFDPEAMWEKKRLLIWGTTYPEFSGSYYETVCTGAVDEGGHLVRIYPVTLRYMKEPFHHYQWIEAEIERNTKDFRPESYKIKQDTISAGEKLDTKHGWAERSKWVLRPNNIFSSVKALQDAQRRDRTSLGLVKPGKVIRVYARRRSEDERKEWDEHRGRALAQKDLFVKAEDTTKELRFVPVEYRAQFTCGDPTCTTEHDMSIRDWGVYVLHRKLFAQYGAGRKGEGGVVSKVEEYLDGSTKDSYVFLGNTKTHPENFMIVGLYYPTLSQKQPKKESAKQLKLIG
jgi:hypothetical protein